MSATPLTRPVPVSPSLPLPHCRRCDFGDRPFDRATAPDVLRDYALRWRRVLADPGTPTGRVGVLAWSPLEHGCHVRDMCLLFRRRLAATLGTAPAGPEPEDLGDPARLTGLYRDEDPRRVAGELVAAAEALARGLAALGPADWDREDPRLPGERLTVEFFTRHLLHDIAHDLGEVLRAAD